MKGFAGAKFKSFSSRPEAEAFVAGNAAPAAAAAAAGGAARAPPARAAPYTMLLTGGSRGIGHGTAKLFAAAGWRVITCSRTPFAAGKCPSGLITQGVPGVPWDPFAPP